MMIGDSELSLPMMKRRTRIIGGASRSSFDDICRCADSATRLCRIVDDGSDYGVIGRQADVARH